MLAKAKYILEASEEFIVRIERVTKFDREIIDHVYYNKKHQGIQFHDDCFDVWDLDAPENLDKSICTMYHEITSVEVLG